MTTVVPVLHEFKLPDIGEGLTEAEILKWHVAPGDTVTDGQIVCEVETAKAAVELPIPFEGVVRELRFAEGETAAVGAVLIAIAPASPERQPVLVGYGVNPGPGRRRARPSHAVVTEPARPAPAVVAERARALAKPPVRRLAKELRVDLDLLTPSGPGGLVTRDDVRAAATAATSATAATPARSDARETRVPVQGVRKATAAAVTSSAFSAPHVTEFLTVDVTRTMKLVDELKLMPEMAGCRVTPLLLVAKAFLTAIGRHTDVNATWDESAGQIVRKHYVNLGIAAATPRGLVVPNIKDAGTLTLRELADSLTALVITARDGKTSPDAMRGGTATLTNIGVFGVDSGTPILNPGESVILAVGAIRRRPWEHKGRVRLRHVVTLALSFDHRVIDGELGSRALSDIGAVLEHPKRLLARS